MVESKLQRMFIGLTFKNQLLHNKALAMNLMVISKSYMCGGCS